MTAKVSFTVKVTANTRELQLRISEIANGWVVKAGGAPYYCETKEELSEAVAEVVDRFVKTK